jgi:hypothetical protein
VYEGGHVISLEVCISGLGRTVKAAPTAIRPMRRFSLFPGIKNFISYSDLHHSVSYRNTAGGSHPYKQ